MATPPSLNERTKQVHDSSKMVYIVLGGAGYIGSHVVATLLAAEKRVICVDTLVNSHSSNLCWVSNTDNLTLVTEDDFKYTDCELVEGIIHVAGLKSIPGSVKTPLDYYENNVGATRRALDLLTETDCKVFVMISTAAVYSSVLHAKENPDLEKPTSPYGKSMLACEEMVRDFVNSPSTSSDTFFHILRVTNVYGGKENPRNKEGLFPSLFKAVQYGTPFTLRMHPQSNMIRDFVHIQDVVNVIRLCLGFRMGDRVKTYNVGSGCPVEISYVVSLCMHQAPTLQVVKEMCLPGEAQISSVSIEKIQNELGWAPQHSNLEKSFSELRTRGCIP